ncbi:MAG: ABC transporter substrate-binding protein [Okeania sp. SIO2G4]|uniref:ABC transporter substrate-binding protein n=1 Tax=unclassified Okeania TaxID=2634635 RepID=UPI0013BB5231|nr:MULTISPECIES: ABC transporter substrate-binding protein [unclassified Okeania]NEP40035.1 ABC transporter substrate-binding protein [Okeania sp. SIO2H7]NEP74267.1 ABC transporter substrate-binding protein [Okeania sp. SIO2G5]NEP95266.1 ABC transporter substrate-binding protein [Okeania sp. SIO2F5]NEQ92989.1 ABC transporter substrate-binding protein [Okeania sp. SIO2G4]
MTQQNLWHKFIHRAKLPLEVGGLFIALILLFQDLGDLIIPMIISDVPNINNSIGEKTMFPSGEISAEKELGMREIKEKRFSSAISYFRKSLNLKKNDPETVIFLNNSIAQAKKVNQNRKILEIAVSIPAHGEANVAAEILRGVAQVQSEFNCGLAEISLAIKDTQHQLNCQGSLNGKFLQVTIVDDKNEPETAKKVAKYLVKQKDIIAIIGHYSSPMTLSAGKVYNKHKLVAISPTSTSTILSNFSKFVFKISSSDKLAAQALFEYLEELGKSQKVAVAYVEKNEYSESLKQEFETVLPTQKFVHQCYLNAGNFSAQDCIEQAKKQGAEVILLVPATDITLTNAIGVIHNSKGLKLIGGDSIYNYRVVNDAGEEAYQNNLTVAIPWHRDPNDEFTQKSKKFWNAEINWRTATSYDATKTIIKALDKSNGNYSRKKLQIILSSDDFDVEGVTGKIRFGELGDRQFLNIDKSVLVQVKPNAKSGKYEFIILEEGIRGVGE